MGTELDRDSDRHPPGHPLRDPLRRGAIAPEIPDADPAETREWLDSVDAVVDHAGRDRAQTLMRSVLDRVRQRHVTLAYDGVTGYVNTISAAGEPPFPGDEKVEHRIRSYVRWNAAMMV